MKRVTYISKFAVNMSDKDIEDIGAVSSQKNRKQGITGALLCVGGLFFQILEGPDNTVDKLYEQIKQDERHTHVLCLKTECNITERLFPDWSMKTINLDKAENDLIRPIKILLQSVTESHRIIERYTQPSVIGTLSQGINPLTLAPRKIEKIILFGDIIAFSTLSEKYPVEAIVQMVNHYLDICSQNISQRHGEITKFIGDCVMAYFDPEYADDAIHACLDILAEIRKLRDSSPQTSPLRRLYCGFGLSRGTVIEGNIGSSVKMDYTILGDPVNAAARLESLTRSVSKAILLSPDVKQGAKDNWNFISMGEFELKGKDERMAVYSIEHNLVREIKTKKQIAEEISK